MQTGCAVDNAGEWRVRDGDAEAAAGRGDRLNDSGALEDLGDAADDVGASQDDSADSDAVSTAFADGKGPVQWWGHG